jgi:hypothetical protein
MVWVRRSAAQAGQAGIELSGSVCVRYRPRSGPVVGRLGRAGRDLNPEIAKTVTDMAEEGGRQDACLH